MARQNLFQFLKTSENRAVASVFFGVSIVFGAWITRLPEIQNNLNISDGALGTALFFLPLGAVTLLPFYSKIIYALGERQATLWGFIILLLTAIVPGYLTEYSALLVNFYVLGLAIGLTDVSMNAVAANIERERATSVMGMCHGFFSLGGMLGAVIAAGFLALRWPLPQQMWVICVVLLVLVFAQRRHLLNATSPELSKGFHFPPKQVVLLALVGLCIMMVEGGITDWSTIYLTREMGMAARYAGLGFGGFSLLMALGRFQADGLLLRIGMRKLLLGGMILGALGLVIVLLQFKGLAIVGFSLSGLGFSAVIPALFGKAAKTPGISPAKGLAAVASAGYVGWLIAPVTIGWLSEAFGLNFGFVFLLGLVVLAFVVSLKVLSR